jgi:hypothetical protein
MVSVGIIAFQDVPARSLTVITGLRWFCACITGVWNWSQFGLTDNTAFSAENENLLRGLFALFGFLANGDSDTRDVQFGHT